MSTTSTMEGFSSSKFDVDTWLNNYVKTLPEDFNAKMTIGQLSQQIDQEIDNSNKRLEGLTKEIREYVPRITRELEIAQREVQGLQGDMLNGLAEAEKVQKSTTVSMTNLEKLDNIKSKLVSISGALQEADKWTSLSKQIEQLLDCGDVTKSYECILGMEKSLAVLNKTQAEERKLILEELKNRLEALATKHLVLAFDTNNKENARYFFIMFTNLERTLQFVKYFQSSEKIKMSQEWRKIVEMHSFKEASIIFYDHLLDHWNSKLQWCKIIFVDNNEVESSNILIDLYSETLRMLEPSMQFCFESETKKVPFLELLVHFNQTTHRFIQNIKQSIDSQNLLVDSTKIEYFLKTLFLPFLSQYPKFAKHHEQMICSKIQSSLSGENAPSNSNDNPTYIQERIDISKKILTEVILYIKESEEKIGQFNQGFCYLHFGKGLNAGLERFIDSNKEIHRILEKFILYPEKRNLVENSLSFAELCGDILKQILVLDKTLSSNCGRIFSRMAGGSGSADPWENLWIVYLDNQIRSEILQFVQKKEMLLGSACNLLRELCRNATNLVLRVTAEPVENQLKKNFAIADSSLKEAIPSEYITQMGEYLMLLPQNLEPYIATENSISVAFDQSTDGDGKSPIDFILSNLSKSICEVYLEGILKAVYLSDGQANQLSCDIDYLGSCLEDLSLRLTSDLSDISKLLKNYSSLNESVSTFEKIPSRLLTAIKKMKTKPSTTI